MTNLNAHADSKYTKTHSNATLSYNEAKFFSGDHAGWKKEWKKCLRKARRAAERRLVRAAY